MTRAQQLAEPRQAPSPVRLKVERLVLHGFAHADRRAVAEGVQSELARLMTEGHPMPSLKKPLALERSDGGTIRMRAGASPEATARQIAQAIFRSLQESTAPAQDLRRMRTGAAGREGKQ